MSPLKRKARFTRLGSESLKKLRLDPAPVPGDSTITTYHERTQALMPDDREKLHIYIPFEMELDQIRDLKSLRPEVVGLRAELDGNETRNRAEVDRLQTELNENRAELNENRAELNENRVELDENRAELAENRAVVDRLQAKLDGNDKSRLSMLIANALVDLARMVAKKYKSELIDDPSTARLQQFAKNVKDSQLLEMGIPNKYWPSLRKLETFMKVRNQQAHETSGSFAQLLLNDQFKEGLIFNVWKDIFPLLYGASVEEIAARGEEEENNMLLGIP